MSNFYKLLTIELTSFLIASAILFPRASLAEQKHVAITQIVSHQSLDKVREGSVDQLRQKFGNEVKFSFSNANGNIATATQIASKIVSDKPDLIIAIATSSAQTVMNSAKDTNIPILFASVTDPRGAKLVKDLKHPGGNISGTVNISPVAEQLALLKKLKPDVKSIGVVLSYAEANSRFMLSKLEEEAKKMAITVHHKSISNSSEVKLAAENLLDKVDAFYLLQDNLVASALPSIIKITGQKHKPVIASFPEAVEQGALFSLAKDEYEIGRQTGAMAIRVLLGENIASMKIEEPSEQDLKINLKVAESLNIIIPKDVLKRAKLL